MTDDEVKKVILAAIEHLETDRLRPARFGTIPSTKGPWFVFDADDLDYSLDSPMVH